MKQLNKSNFYYKAGLSEGLKGSLLNKYVTFMIKRYPSSSSTVHAKEWARRFRKREEWYFSDMKSKKILDSLNYAIKTKRVM